MDKRIEEGIVSLNERKAQMTEKNIQILEQVKSILMISNTDFMTVKMAADYFEVGLKAIHSLINDNREELENNGLKVYKKKEFLNILEKDLRNDEQLNGKSILTFEDNTKLTFPNRGLTLVNIII